MAGCLAVVLHLNEEEEATERSGSAAAEWSWQVMFSRFVHFPAVSGSSHPLLTPARAKRNGGVRGIWLSSSSPTAILQLVVDRSCSDAKISVSLGGRVLEEHYVSKLHFSWPQVSCTAGYPPRGTRSVVVSFKDSAGLIQKFAFQFSSVSESASFIATLKELLEYPASTGHRASIPKSEISTHPAIMSTEMPPSRDLGGESNTMSPFNALSPELPPSISTHSAIMSTEMPLSRDFGEESNTISPFNAYSPELPPSISTHSAIMSTELPVARDFEKESNTMSPFKAYSPELPLNISNEVQQDPVPEDTSLTHISNNNNNNNNMSTVKMPPSFTSLLSNCCPKIQQEVMKLPDEEDYPKTQIAEYMEDASFQDMLFKVEKIFGEIGGDLIL